MNKVYDVCLPKKNSKGEFVKNKDGKTVYDNWGSVMKDSEGHLKLILKTLQGDVWFSLFTVKDASEPRKETVSVPEVGDEIPF